MLVGIELLFVMFVCACCHYFVHCLCLYTNTRTFNACLSMSHSVLSLFTVCMCVCVCCLLCVLLCAVCPYVSLCSVYTLCPSAVM